MHSVVPEAQTYVANPRFSRARRLWLRYGTGLLFLAPAALLYTVFVLVPFFGSVWLSCERWDGVAKVRPFIGLSNYRRLIHDPLFWDAAAHNLIWVIIDPAIAISLGLIVAVVLWSRPFGFNLFRTVFFLPQVIGPAIIGVIWKFIYEPWTGMLGEVADLTGLSFLKRGWLGNADTAFGSVMAADIWSAIGFFMVIFLSGLQSVDVELMQAAKLDGANAVQRLWHVVIPQLSPVLTMSIVLALIGSLNLFDLVWAMTQGGPGNATDVLGTFTYTKAFEENEFGYGASVSVVMTAMAVLLSWTLIRFRRQIED